MSPLDGRPGPAGQPKSVSGKPTASEIASAHGKAVPDLIAPALRVLFRGLNPSLYSAVVGHHFARPGNRFWPTPHAAGFTERVLSPADGTVLLGLAYGITNLVARATASASELSADALIAGGHRLEEKVRLYHPAMVALLGITADRTAFSHERAVFGRRDAPVGRSGIWVLPNPSDPYAHYPLAGLAELY